MISLCTPFHILRTCEAFQKNESTDMCGEAAPFWNDLRELRSVARDGALPWLELRVDGVACRRVQHRTVACGGWEDGGDDDEDKGGSHRWGKCSVSDRFFFRANLIGL